MSTNIIPFCFESQSVRVINVENDPWFVAKDVCEVLDIKWRGSTTLAYLDDDEKGVRNFRTPSGEQELLIISESGLYTLIIRSNKPQAKPFRRWVTKEVLPTIRKTGGYLLPDTREVNVNHNHHRTPTGPGGIDVRYTMDLSKIIAKPNRTTIALLERLTGIQMIDLIPADDSDEAIVSMFIAERCVRTTANEDYRTRLMDIHAEFKDWWQCSNDARQSATPTAKWLAAVLRKCGLEVDARGGITWVYRLMLTTNGKN